MYLWLCPNDCGHYYGAPSAERLDQLKNQDLFGNEIGTRHACPRCKTKGAGVVFLERHKIESVKKDDPAVDHTVENVT